MAFSRLKSALGYGTALLVHGREEIFDLETLEILQSNQLSIGRNSQLKPIDHGLRGSLSIARNMDRYQLFAKTSYQLGFRDMVRFMTSKNRSLNINLGVLVPLQNSPE